MVISHPYSHYKGTELFSNLPFQSAAKFPIMRLFIWDNKASNRILKYLGPTGIIYEASYKENVPKLINTS